MSEQLTVSISTAEKQGAGDVACRRIMWCVLGLVFLGLLLLALPGRYGPTRAPLKSLASPEDVDFEHCLICNYHNTGSTRSRLQNRLVTAVSGSSRPPQSVNSDRTVTERLHNKAPQQAPWAGM
jgi:hypothetical protein